MQLVFFVQCNIMNPSNECILLFCTICILATMNLGTTWICQVNGWRFLEVKCKVPCELKNNEKIPNKYKLLFYLWSHGCLAAWHEIKWLFRAHAHHILCERWEMLTKSCRMRNWSKQSGGKGACVCKIEDSQRNIISWMEDSAHSSSCAFCTHYSYDCNYSAALCLCALVVFEFHEILVFSYAVQIMRVSYLTLFKDLHAWVRSRISRKRL